MTLLIFRDNSHFEILSILTSFPLYVYVLGEENAPITHLFILLQRIKLALLWPSYYGGFDPGIFVFYLHVVTTIPPNFRWF